MSGNTTNMPSPEKGALLSVRGLAIHFSTPKGILRAVKGIDFDIAHGETLGIVGESGSGKSVTSMGLLDLLPGNTLLKDGTVRFDGKTVFSSASETKELMNANKRRSLRGSGIGTVFQEPGRSFDPIYPVGKTMEETVRAHFPGMPDPEIRSRCIDRLREVNVPEPEQRINNYPHQFSGGLLQRIMIATSLLCDPKLLIADEPTTSLDVTIQAGIMQLLAELKEKRGLSILFITHDLALISQLANRIIVMYAGHIMEEGPTENVLGAPCHPYTRALLDTIPDLGDHYRTRRIRAIPGQIPDPVSVLPGCPFEPRCRFSELAGKDKCQQGLPAVMDGETRYRCLLAGPKPSGSSEGETA